MQALLAAGGLRRALGCLDKDTGLDSFLWGAVLTTRAEACSLG